MSTIIGNLGKGPCPFPRSDVRLNAPYSKASGPLPGLLFLALYFLYGIHFRRIDARGLHGLLDTHVLRRLICNPAPLLVEREPGARRNEASNDDIFLETP